MNRLSELLKSADQLNPSSTISEEWFQAVRGSVSRARVHRKVFRVASGITAILLVMFGGANLYAQGVSPDHSLYPMKQFGEHLVVLATPQSQRAFVYRHLIDRRVEEAKQDPGLASVIIPDIVKLIAEQEKVIAEENLQAALAHSIQQTTMFEQDIERLRNVRQTREIALALTLSHQRLLERLQANQGGSLDQNFPTRLPPLDLMLIRSGEPSTQTPEDLKVVFDELESARQLLVGQQSTSLIHLLQFLKTRNDLHLQLIQKSLP